MMDTMSRCLGAVLVALCSAGPGISSPAAGEDKDDRSLPRQGPESASAELGRALEWLRKAFLELVADFQSGGICECIHPDGYRQLPSYVVSAINPLAAAEKLWGRGAGAWKSAQTMPLVAGPEGGPVPSVAFWLETGLRRACPPSPAGRQLKD
jgi:hypothetical protein